MSPVPAVLSGTLVLDPAYPVPSGSVVHVVVEDTTLIDAAAVPVARISLLTGVSQDDRGLHFLLPVPGVDPSRRYEVRAHMDLDGDGRISSGDQISTTSTPVLTEGHPSTVTVQLRHIT